MELLVDPTPSCSSTNDEVEAIAQEASDASRTRHSDPAYQTGVESTVFASIETQDTIPSSFVLFNSYFEIFMASTEIVSIAEAARRLTEKGTKVSPRTLSRAVRRSKVRTVKIGTALGITIDQAAHAYSNYSGMARSRK